MDEAGPPAPLLLFECSEDETDRVVVLAVPSEWCEWFGKASRKGDVFCLVPPKEERRKIVRREAESPDPLRRWRWPVPDTAAAVVVVGAAVMLRSGWRSLPSVGCWLASFVFLEILCGARQVEGFEAKMRGQQMASLRHPYTVSHKALPSFQKRL